MLPALVFLFDQLAVVLTYVYELNYNYENMNESSGESGNTGLLTLSIFMITIVLGI
jgi:hypothetical protein